jgi:hypothetical protein
VREAEIQIRIQEWVNTDGRIRLRRNSVGFDRERKVSYGFGVGSPDLIGIQRGTGRMVAIEVKSANGRVASEQKQWASWFVSWGGLYLLARSIEEVKTWIYQMPPLS